MYSSVKGVRVLARPTQALEQPAGGAHVTLFGMCAVSEGPAGAEPDDGAKTAGWRKAI